MKWRTFGLALALVFLGAIALLLVSAQLNYDNVYATAVQHYTDSYQTFVIEWSTDYPLTQAAEQR